MFSVTYLTFVEGECFGREAQLPFRPTVGESLRIDGHLRVPIAVSWDDVTESLVVVLDGWSTKDELLRTGWVQGTPQELTRPTAEKFSNTPSRRGTTYNVEYSLALSDTRLLVKRANLPFAPARDMLYLLDDEYRRPVSVAWVENDQVFEVLFEHSGLLIIEEMQRHGWTYRTPRQRKHRIH